MTGMYVRTLPREIAARWVKPGDEVAVYSVGEDRWKRCHTEGFVERYPHLVAWMLVVDGSQLVRPPADAAAGRPEGLVQHSAGGWWSVEPQRRDRVPDELDHVGAHRIVLMPINGGQVGPPVTVYVTEKEQLVIRERVKVEAPRDAWLAGYREGGRNTRGGMHMSDARLRIATEPAADQRDSARVTASDAQTPRAAGGYGHGQALLAIVRADTGEQAAIADAAALAAIDDTRQLPTSRIPLGVMGQSLGRPLDDGQRTVQVFSPRGDDITADYTGDEAS